MRMERGEVFPRCMLSLLLLRLLAYLGQFGSFILPFLLTSCHMSSLPQQRSVLEPQFDFGGKGEHGERVWEWKEAMHCAT